MSSTRLRARGACLSTLGESESRKTPIQPSEIPPYQGPHQVEGIDFRLAAHAFGVSAWGMSVMEISAGGNDSPEHDHQADGHIIVDVGKEQQISEQLKHSMVRVEPHVKRKLLPGSAGLQVLAIGGTPTKAYPVPGSKL